MSGPRIFVSYSHRGRGPDWKSSLLRALHVFDRHYLLDVWQDGKIRVSTFWDDDIKQAMHQAQAAVVLLTPEALESPYVLETEFPYLRERQEHARLPVFPVVCEPCDWRAHDWLRATQAPNESRPLSELAPERQDHLFRRLATHIAEELGRLALATVAGTDSPQGGRQHLEQFPLTLGSGTREETLIGRQQELALLDLALVEPGTAVASLVAGGGVGKTALVQRWLQRLQREDWFRTSRVYAWSFYSQGTKEDRQASEDNFLAHALGWFRVECAPTRSPWDKGHLLAEAVARERTLVILDGVEPLQYPPGPMGGELRAPGVQSFLKALARIAHTGEHRCLCLVTTREPLVDLAAFQRRPGDAWGSVLRVDLENLTEEAGAELLHQAGATRAGPADITAGDAELFAASRAVGGHALTLNLLGRFLARAHHGDVRRRDLVKFEEADRTTQGGTTFRMLGAFENWFERGSDVYKQQLAILRVLGLFDRPADAGCIAALLSAPVIAGLTEPLFQMRRGRLGWGKRYQPLSEEDVAAATSFLADFGLVVIRAGADSRQGLLDCHPLTREYFAGRFRAGNAAGWHAAHRRLYEHLRSGAEHRPGTLEGLQPLYQAVAHGCQANLHQQAFDGIFRDRIDRGTEAYAIHKLGAFGSQLATIACFFDRPWSDVSPRLEDQWHAWMLHGAAYCLAATGRLLEAIEPTKASMDIDASREKWKGAAMSANNLSEFKLTMGDVSAAVADARASVGFADHRDEPHQRLSNRTALAAALHQAGQLAESMALFRDAEQIQVRYQPAAGGLYGLSGFRYCDFLLTDPEREAFRVLLGLPMGADGSSLASCQDVEKRAARALAIARQGSQNLIGLASSELALGRALLYRHMLDRRPLTPDSRAHAHLLTAVDALRRSSKQDLVPLGLLSRACLRVLEGDSTGAQTDLDEAWQIAERGPMRLHMADVHLHRARLFSRERPYPWTSPEDDLAAAEKLISGCGYHRRDGELSDARQSVLANPA